MTLAMHLQELDQVVLHDAVFVRTDGDEPALPTEDGDPAPVAAAVPSALLGALIGTFVAGPMGFLIGGVLGGGGGATIAKLLGSGIRDPIVRELRGRLRPGQTALGLQVSHVADEHAFDELRRLPGAQVLPTTTTPPSAIARPARGTC